MQDIQKLLDQVRFAIREKHYSIKTEEAYVGWINRFLLFHKKQQPRLMHAKQISQFLSYLATQRKVAVSTLNQASNALTFLYRFVLKIDLNEEPPIGCAKPSKERLTDATEGKNQCVLSAMSGRHALMHKLLYGSGLRD